MNTSGFNEYGSADTCCPRLVVDQMTAQLLFCEADALLQFLSVNF
jgi:hypothetical protein